jgi:hypothetical protein
MNDEILVLDDVIPRAYTDAIENLIFKLNFPWWYQADSSFGDNPGKPAFPSLNHVLVRHQEVVNPSFDFFLPMVHFVGAKIGHNFTKILSAKSCLQLPIIMSSNDRSNNPHIDVNFDHTVILYYVNDSDGDTIIYDKKIKKNENFIKENLTVKQKVSPKKGRFLVFNGNYLHNSTTPQFGTRCILNFDVV